MLPLATVDTLQVAPFDFLRSGDAFAFPHPPFRLCNDLLNQRKQFGELLS